MGEVRLLLWPRERVREEASRLLGLWLKAFSGPPYFARAGDLPRVRRLFYRHLEAEGFLFVAALVGEDLVGFAYGFPRHPGDPWTEEVARSLAPDLRRRWLEGAFGFVELAVDPDHQGQGIGSALHDALLAEARRPRAVLTVHEKAKAADFYRRRGWLELGRLEGSDYLIMGRELAGKAL